MDHAHTILIVDDELENRMVLEEILAEEFNVVAAASGEEALQLLPGCSPLVVLMDVMMGNGMNGFEACRKIREELKSGCVVIMLSAVFEYGGSEKGFSAGADDFVTKPFHGDMLMAKLRRFKRTADMENGDRIRSEFLAHLADKRPGTIFSAPCGTGSEASADSVESWENRLGEIAEKTMFLSILTEGRIREGYGDSLPDHLEKIARGLEPVISKRQMDLVVDPGELTSLHVDWSIFSRALGYLVQYAVHTSPDGSMLSITASTHKENCRIRLTHGGTDTGPADLLTESRPVQELINHEGGMGLNLAVAKSAMALMGGSVKSLEEPPALLLDFPRDTRPKKKKLR